MIDVMAVIIGRRVRKWQSPLMVMWRRRGRVGTICRAVTPPLWGRSMRVVRVCSLSVWAVRWRRTGVRLSARRKIGLRVRMVRWNIGGRQGTGSALGPGVRSRWPRLPVLLLPAADPIITPLCLLVLRIVLRVLLVLLSRPEPIALSLLLPVRPSARRRCGPAAPLTVSLDVSLGCRGVAATDAVRRERGMEHAKEGCVVPRVLVRQVDLQPQEAGGRIFVICGAVILHLLLLLLLLLMMMPPFPGGRCLRCVHPATEYSRRGTMCIILILICNE